VEFPPLLEKILSSMIRYFQFLTSVAKNSALSWPEVLHLHGRFFCICVAESSALYVAGYIRLAGTLEK
jgi:hypothetical protein